MGIAVVALNILDSIEIKSSIIMLGIGLVCLAMYLMDNNEKND